MTIINTLVSSHLIFAGTSMHNEVNYRCFIYLLIKVIAEHLNKMFHSLLLMIIVMFYENHYM